MSFYATRTIDNGSYKEHQLLKFYSKLDRTRYDEAVGCNSIPAREAGKLMKAGAWMTCRSTEADCIFFVVQYIPE